MKLDANVRVGKLVDQYPFLLDTLTAVSAKFKVLHNPLMRKTVGQFATLGKAAQLGEVALADLLESLANAIREKTGETVEIDAAEAAPDGPGVELDPERVAKLREIIKGLHEGKGVDAVKDDFARLIKNVSPSEIAAMEQQLVQEGLPEEEITRLCDVHVAVFRESLDDTSRTEVPSGHPVDTFRRENAAIMEVIALLRKLLSEPGTSDPEQLSSAFARLAEIEKHYIRKENELFPQMEQYGVTAPPKVMWSIHDDVRAQLKDVRGALDRNEAPTVQAQAPALLTIIEDMVYKEENILFPMCLELLSQENWARVHHGEKEVGYTLIEPGPAWQPAATPAAQARPSGLNALPLDTGLLTLEQVNLLLTHLPVDLSFVDEHGEVRYYSESPARIFPRSPGVIGRQVENCHPSKSVHMVNRILEEFRAGTKDTADFWFEMGGRFIYVRYFALRSPDKTYRGCLEVSQDVTEIRALTDSKRLLDWE